MTYSGSFAVEHIPKKIKKFINNGNITINIFRAQAYNSTMCRYFCIEFIDLILKQKVFVRLNQFIFS